YACRHAGHIHQDEGHKHGKGYGYCNHHRAAHAAQKHDQNDADKGNAQKNGMRDLVDRELDEVLAIDVRHDVNIHWIELSAQFIELHVQVLDDLRGILVFQHLHDAFDRIWIFVLAEDAFSFLMGIAERSEVVNQDRHGAALGHDNIAEIFQ